MLLHPPIPILRIFDAALARQFYNTDDVEALHRELATRPNPNMRPGVELAPWNPKVMEVTDPFGNRLCFNQPLGQA